jgi:hypothetical protein
MIPLEKNKDSLRQSRFRLNKGQADLLEEMQAWQHESAEIFLRFERDLILEQQVVIVTEERPA